jgi:hypothetical protein
LLYAICKARGLVLKAYCWDISFVSSSSQPSWEDTRNKTSTTLAGRVRINRLYFRLLSMIPVITCEHIDIRLAFLIWYY